jgi:hypothetical protein
MTPFLGLLVSGKQDGDVKNAGPRESRSLSDRAWWESLWGQAGGAQRLRSQERPSEQKLRRQTVETLQFR